MEEFIQSLEKLKKQIESIKNNEYFPLINFLINKGKELTKEINIFNEDYIKYRTGVYLWLNEKYPNLLEFLNILSKQKISFEIKVLNGIETSINEYFNFIKEVENSSPNLFQEEFNESKSLEFGKTIRPINILRQKNAIINCLLNDLNKNVSSYIDPFKVLVIKHTPELKKDVESYVEKVKPAIGERLELVSKWFKGEINQEEYDKALLEKNRELEKNINEFKQKSKILIDNISEERQQIQKDTDQFLLKIREITNIFKEAYSQDNTKIICEYLLLTKDIDSFNIKLTKFLNRLFHILTMKDKTYKIHYQIGKYHPQERIDLKKFLSTDFKRKYPNLSEFLLKCFKYNKFRRLEAHEIPDKIKLSNDKRIAYIPKTGKSADIQMDVEEIKTVINTYCFFIDAIGI